MGAPLDMAWRSSLLLRSAQTLSTTLLGFDFLQRPQHVLSNLLDRPHSSVLARSTTITSSSAFPFAFALAFSPVSALRLPIGWTMEERDVRGGHSYTLGVDEQLLLWPE